MRNAKIDTALEASISRERLAKYLDAADGDLSEALSLYERNMLISEAFYVPLQSLEVCLRNKLFEALSASFGQHWLTDHTAAPLDDHSRSFVNDALSQLPTGPSPGQIVAELRFAFWVGLLARKYDADIWRHAGYKVFLARGGKPRKAVHGRMNALRRFRNRIAHHEPIFNRDLANTHAEVLEAIEWMCPATRAWTEHHSRVTDELARGLR